MFYAMLKIMKPKLFFVVREAKPYGLHFLRDPQGTYNFAVWGRKWKYQFDKYK